MHMFRGHETQACRLARLVLGCFVAAGVVAAAPIVDLDAAGNATGIRNVEIAGLGTVDIDFVFGAYTDVYPNGPATFGHGIDVQPIVDALNQPLQTQQPVPPGIADGSVVSQSFHVGIFSSGFEGTMEYFLEPTFFLGPGGTVVQQLEWGVTVSGGLSPSGPPDVTGIWATVVPQQTAVPEPGSVVLVATTLIGLGIVRRRRS